MNYTFVAGLSPGNKQLFKRSFESATAVSWWAGCVEWIGYERVRIISLYGVSLWHRIVRDIVVLSVVVLLSASCDYIQLVTEVETFDRVSERRFHGTVSMPVSTANVISLRGVQGVNRCGWSWRHHWWQRWCDNRTTSSHQIPVEHGLCFWD